MNQLDYVVAITEDADTLFTLERQARHPKERQRLQLVRLLKSGLAMTMPEAAALVGISHSTADRQWRTYNARVSQPCVLWRTRADKCSAPQYLDSKTVLPCV